MSLLDGMIAGNFAKDDQDRTVFYPMGLKFGLAKGYLLPDEDHERRARSLLKRYFVGVMCLVGLLAFVNGLIQVDFAWALVGTALSLVWYIISIRRFVNGLPESAHRLTWLESIRATARAQSPWIIWSQLVACLLMFVLGMWMAVTGGNSGDRMIGALLALMMTGAAWFQTVLLRHRS